jgi:hypothetical protein
MRARMDLCLIRNLTALVLPEQQNGAEPLPDPPHFCPTLPLDPRW